MGQLLLQASKADRKQDNLGNEGDKLSHQDRSLHRLAHKLSYLGKAGGFTFILNPLSWQLVQ